MNSTWLLLVYKVSNRDGIPIRSVQLHLGFICFELFRKYNQHRTINRSRKLAERQSDELAALLSEEKLVNVQWTVKRIRNAINLKFLY